MARAILPVKADLEAHKLRSQAVRPCCPEADLMYVHTRMVRPTALLGPIDMPVPTFHCHGCGASLRPDGTALGVPSVGDFTDDIRIYIVETNITNH